MRTRRGFTAHRADDSKCPVFLQQREIRLIMSTSCLNIKEAEFLFRKGLRYSEPEIDRWPSSTFSDYINTSKLTFAACTAAPGNPNRVVADERSVLSAGAPPDDQHPGHGTFVGEKDMFPPLHGKMKSPDDFENSSNLRVITRNHSLPKRRSSLSSFVSAVTDPAPVDIRDDYIGWARLSSGGSHPRNDPGGQSHSLSSPSPDAVGLSACADAPGDGRLSRPFPLPESSPARGVLSGTDSQLLISIKGNPLYKCLNKANNNCAKILLNSLLKSNNSSVEKEEDLKLMHSQILELNNILSLYCLNYSQ